MDKIEKAVELYKNGMPLLKAWEATGCGRNKLQQTLKDRGLIRSNKQNSRKYTLNENFFETIDTEAKAYWLGFMYADGYVTHSKRGQKAVGIALGRKDKEHLERFREALEATYEVKDYTGDSYNKKVEYSRLWMTSEKLFDDLVAKGVVENKSLILKFPTEDIVPSNLLHHFIRGYFDGDGSFSYTGKRDDTYAVKIEGTESFLMGLAWGLGYYVESDSLHIRHKDKRSSYSLHFHAKGDVRAIGDYMYKDATIYLDRKYQRYRQV